jgi:soluble lytic murein transglycosylase-like protein
MSKSALLICLLPAQQVQQLQQQFAAAEQTDKQQQQAGKRQAGPSQFAQQWNSQLLQRLQATAGVSGLHVMPITANSKRMALQMARQGAFASRAWPLAGGAATQGSSRPTSSSSTSSSTSPVP